MMLKKNEQNTHNSSVNKAKGALETRVVKKYTWNSKPIRQRKPKLWCLFKLQEKKILPVVFHVVNIHI